ncbi:hypothetical protein [Streptomyces sp. NBC_00299]|uniref:hypothetical protein n=1 Tax=Streptomyces sp. NBC_00299 TaxID=2975705 RepID=UPI002E2CDDE8|nr:hypothetical protein [Streptomyces sp. NBC_00299]
MSYDLAVWEGVRPPDDAAAGQLFRDLYNRCIDTDVEHPPTDRIPQYVAALLKRWPDLTVVEEEDVSPWSTGPLIGEARGPLIYFSMVYSMAKEVSAHAAQVASSLGLVCYDPQIQQLRS